jgi:hypothetical protein
MSSTTELKVIEENLHFGSDTCSTIDGFNISLSPVCANCYRMSIGDYRSLILTAQTSAKTHNSHNGEFHQNSGEVGK